MKKALLLVLLPLVSSVIATAQGIVVHDLTTGMVNGTNTPIAYASPDDTWQVSFPSSPSVYHNTYVCSNLNGAWGINNCGRWITTKLDLDGVQPFSNVTAGTFQYKTVFSLSNHCFPWAKVTFSYIGGDNNVISFSLNGHDYPLNPGTTNDYNPLTQNISFYVDINHLQIGSNEIIIKVNNSESYTGLFVCGNVSVGFCP